MTEIPGVTVTYTDFSAPTTPRLINIPDVAGDVKVQDLIDTLSALQALLDDIIYAGLMVNVDTSGKVVYDVGKLSGLILKLNNAQVKFQDLSGPSFKLKRVTDGVIAAVDHLGNRIVPIANSSFVNFQIEQDISAALIDSAAQFGSLQQVVIRVEDGASSGIPDVNVTVYAADNTTFLTSARTNQQGDVVVALQIGTFNVRLAKSQHSFTVPEILTVIGDQTTTFIATLFVPPLPSAPDLCVIFGTVLDADGDPSPGLSVVARSTVPQDEALNQFSEEEVCTVTDVNGFFQIELVQNTEVSFKIKEAGIDFIRIVPAAASQDITTWV